SRIGSDERQFVWGQQVVGLIAHNAGWKKSVSLRVECLLHWWSSSPDKEQQGKFLQRNYILDYICWMKLSLP
ncbi:hypothetical protein GOODEAATRI_007302, partial [Goodea atripinnis]